MRFNLPSKECNKTIALGLAIWIACPVAGSADSYEVVSGAVKAVCRLTIGASFDVKSSAVSGALSLDPEHTEKLLGEITLDLRTLETGIQLRDSHLRDRYLEVEAPENRLAVLTGIQVEGLAARRFGAGTYPFRARLRLRGHERDVVGKVGIRGDARQLNADAVFPMRLSDFQIARPGYLGIGVSDDLTVHVKLRTLMSDGQPSSASSPSAAGSRGKSR